MSRDYEDDDVDEMLARRRARRGNRPLLLVGGAVGGLLLLAVVVLLAAVVSRGRDRERQAGGGPDRGGEVPAVGGPSNGPGPTDPNPSLVGAENHPWWKRTLRPGRADRILTEMQNTISTVIVFNQAGDFVSIPMSTIRLVSDPGDGVGWYEITTAASLRKPSPLAALPGDWRFVVVHVGAGNRLDVVTARRLLEDAFRVKSHQERGRELDEQSRRLDKFLDRD